MVKWNLEHIYKFKETDKLLNTLKNKVKKFEQHRSKLTEDISQKDFMKILKEYEEIYLLSSKLSGYPHLWLSENTADSKRLSHVSKIDEILTDMGNQIMFFGLWLKEISDKKAEELIKGSGKYGYYIKEKRLFKDHTLKENEEKILNIKSLTGGDALVKLYDIITNKFRYDWNGKKISGSELRQYVYSSDPKIREKCYRTLLGKYGEESASLGELYKSLVNKNENIKLRKFSNPISVRNLSNDISDSIVESLFNVLRKNIHLFQEYFKLKAKLLGMKKLRRFDFYAHYKMKERKYSYEEAKKITLDVYKSLSPEAYKCVTKIFNEKHVHSDLTDNKQNGAFCSSIHVGLTPYILLNHTGTLNDVFTMVHEFGHGLHSLTAKDQTPFTFHSSIPMAETASIFGEMLLYEKMLSKMSDKEKATLLVTLIDDEYASIIRQGYFALFEKTAHDMIAKNATVEELDIAYFQNLKEQFGESVDLDEIFKHEWKYIPHLYHWPFYVYAYVFGNLLVLALFKLYKQEGKTFVPKYMRILAAGGSDSPVNILKKEGIYIYSEKFWQGGFDIIKDQIEMLNNLVEKENKKKK